MHFRHTHMHAWKWAGEVEPMIIILVLRTYVLLERVHSVTHVQSVQSLQNFLMLQTGVYIW